MKQRELSFAAEEGVHLEEKCGISKAYQARYMLQRNSCPHTQRNMHNNDQSSLVNANIEVQSKYLATLINTETEVELHVSTWMNS